MGNRLRQLRKAREWTHERAAKEIGVSKSHFIKLERGERRLNDETLARAAAAFGVSQGEIVEQPRTVPLVGYVGAGAEASFFGEGQGAGQYDVVDAPEGSNETTVAVEIRGESLGSFFDRWLVFYDEVRDPPTTDMLNKLCVVGLDDGRVLIKKLGKSGQRGRFTLHAQFAEPIYDARVDWAALVRAMVPQ